MEPDILGGEFERITLPMADDYEGEVVATLVRRRAPGPAGRAVLYVHGYIDYFFQAELAERYLEQGINFYALDLRKCGRSLLPHQTLYFCKDVREYYPELDAALRIIREEDGHTRLLLNGHSTGGLIAALYAHAHRDRGTIDALFLNSPFFELPGSWAARELAAPVIARLGAASPFTTVPGGISDLYPRSIHKDYRGEWDFDLRLKPIEGIPLRAGWLRAIRAAQQRLHHGLAIACPVLMMTSARSSSPKQWDDLLLRTDAVLDVEAIGRHALALGDHVTRIRIEDGMHDLVLSAAPVRERVYRELFAWTSAYLPPDRGRRHPGRARAQTSATG
jgi:alpha-beta hydrolase superfamily lysophospholipase